MGIVTEPVDITDLLQAWEGGARDAVVEVVYEDLKRLADARIRTEAETLTIDATDLAHEAFLRLADQRQVRWKNRAHFFAIAARVMRRILVDRYRARRARKRGGDVTWVVLGEGDAAITVEVDLEALSDALDRLASQDERQARIVEMRFFAGMTVEDSAEAIGISPATLKREWTLARAWLKREMDGGR
jgi:RNA polymerase sigma factor (TIGR02999 family)